MPLKQMLGLNFKPLASVSPILRPQSPTVPFNKFKFAPKNAKNRIHISVRSQNDKRNSEYDPGSKNAGSVNGRSGFNMRWADLVLNPDPDNIVAVGLTGILTWAAVQILWQLLVIAFVILVTAVKYTVVATLLVLILVALL